MQRSDDQVRVRPAAAPGATESAARATSQPVQPGARAAHAALAPARATLATGPAFTAALATLATASWTAATLATLAARATGVTTRRPLLRVGWPQLCAVRLAVLLL